MSNRTRINREIKRKELHDRLIGAYYYDEDEPFIIDTLKGMNKVELIRFVNYLLFYYPHLYVDINGRGEMNLYKTPK